MPPSATAADSAAPVSPPSVAAIFLGFLTISLIAFGGVLPWARRMIVEQKGWLSGTEFTEMLALCQFLPGPNIVNLSVALGARFHGIPGAFAGFGGIMVMPMAIVMALGAVYERYGNLPALHGILAGLAPAAAGLVIATVVKIGLPVFRGGFHVGKLFAVVAFAAVALLHFPLPYVVVALAPFSVAAAWWRLR
ncbi:MAG TPA: chromate transporter [Hyphomicrobiales bacterium]|nr:chromate transporter [Hyphomicrobiales bacterium]